jgi:hypothetical protein
MPLFAWVGTRAATALAPEAPFQRRSPTAPLTAVSDRDYFPRA